MAKVCLVLGWEDSQGGGRRKVEDDQCRSSLEVR